MKQNFSLLVLIFLLVLIHKNTFSNYTQDEDLNAFLTISFQNSAMFGDSASNDIIKSKIETIFENEGVHIIHLEKPEEYKLNINIIIKDSLIIETKSTGTSGNSIITVKHPRVSYPYKNESEIYNSIKDYIKNNL